ncbi:MAG: AAA family ATPase [Thermoplasmata archaeon]|nr:AAA family ATPase [Thermoplasmata archaeon]
MDDTPTVDRPRMRTYVDGLDERISGGFVKGHVILVAGTPGTMKSSFALNLAYNSAKNDGIKVLYISIEESRDSLLTAMKSLGMTEIDESKIFIVDIGRLRLEHSDADSGRDWFRILKEYLKKKVETEGIQLVVLDSLTAVYALTTMENPRQQLFQFFGFLKSLGVTTILISETRLGESNRYGPHYEEYLTDGTILLKFVDVGETDVQLRIRIVKIRHSKIYHGDLTLLFKDGKFTVTTPLTE